MIGLTVKASSKKEETGKVEFTQREKETLRRALAEYRTQMDDYSDFEEENKILFEKASGVSYSSERQVLNDLIAYFV